MKAPRYAYYLYRAHNTPDAVRILAGADDYETLTLHADPAHDMIWAVRHRACAAVRDLGYQVATSTDSEARYTRLALAHDAATAGSEEPQP